MSDERKDSQMLPLLFGWALAGIPLAWGVYQTLVKARALFP